MQQEESNDIEDELEENLKMTVIIHNNTHTRRMGLP